MAQEKRWRKATLIVYALLCTGIAWQIKAVAGMFGPAGKFPQVHSYKVTIAGDVRRPGTYRVPEGTTQFEIFKAAGVRPTSDLSSFNLMSAVEENTALNVNTRPNGVGLNQQRATGRLEFFFGDVTITAKDGRSVPTREGIGLAEGYRILTEISSQAELSIGPFSRVDMDAFSDLSFDKLGAVETDHTIFQMFQKGGICWYKITASAKTEQYRVLTPSVGITVGVGGADFLVDIQADKTLINLADGSLSIERTGGTESMNLISGQTVNIYGDGRPFQVSRLAPDLSAQERFSQLAQGRKSAAAKNLPLNFLFCGTPAVFFMVSVQFEKGVVTTVSIPPRLSVEQFAEGLKTLDEAYLYGGPAFVNSILERVFSVRVSHFCVFSKDNIIKTADILGGITTTLNAKTAGQLKMPVGQRKLLSGDLVRFLSPSGVTIEENRARQRQILDAIFDNLHSRNIILTSVSVQQILSSIESDFSLTESMDYYARFTSGSGWKFRNIELPVQETTFKGRTTYVPILDRCQAILIQSN